jgi:hypothetical protein
MSGAWIAALLLQAAPGAPDGAARPAEVVPLALERTGVRVGERVVVTAALPVAAGARFHFSRPPDVDPAFARVEPTLADGSGGGPATLRLEMVAAAAGTFKVGPFSLHVEEPGGGAAAGREIETSALDVEVGPSWGPGRPPGFDEWRGPVAPAPARTAPRWPWIAAAAALLLALGWIARRRREAPLAPAVPGAPSRSWRDELGRLAAHIPEGLAARRLWWSDLSRVLREELALRWRDSTRDRTTEELATGAGAGSDGANRGELVRLLEIADDGKFTRASADVGAASSAVTSALRLLEPEAPAAQTGTAPP